MKKERIMSYNLARELSKDEINSVSGAGANTKMTTTTTQQFSNCSHQSTGYDVIGDVSFDF